MNSSRRAGLNSPVVFLITARPAAATPPASAAAATATACAPTAPHPHTGAWAAKTLSLLTGSSGVDRQLAIVQVERIEHANRFLRFRLGAHFHKRKTSGAVGVAILDDFRRSHAARLREQN